MKLCLVIAAGKDVRESARRAIDKMGFLCAEAEDGQFAYVSSQALMPDFIILDLDDPANQGEDFIGKIRNLKKGNRPLIVCCMSEDDRIAVSRVLRAGANGCVLKPLSFEALAAHFLRQPVRKSEMATLC